MTKQLGLEFEKASVTERINTLSEEQKEAIRAALKTLFNAAVYFDEEKDNDQ